MSDHKRIFYICCSEGAFPKEKLSLELDTHSKNILFPFGLMFHFLTNSFLKKNYFLEFIKYLYKNWRIFQFAVTSRYWKGVKKYFCSKAKGEKEEREKREKESRFSRE